MQSLISSFFVKAPDSCGPIYNERSLQLELGYYFRSNHAQVEFERPFNVTPLKGSTCRQKTNLDLLIGRSGRTTAIELKVPLNGRHPETLYDFCNDIAFVEGIVRGGLADEGLCILMTNDRVFWNDSGRGSEIHHLFRRKGSLLTGAVKKPTGSADTTIVVSGLYSPADKWSAVRDARLMKDARYLVIEVTP